MIMRRVSLWRALSLWSVLARCRRFLTFTKSSWRGDYDNDYGCEWVPGDKLMGCVYGFMGYEQ